MLERFGSVADVDAAALSMTKRETARAVERSGVFRRSRMMNLISAYLSRVSIWPELRPRGSRGSAAQMESFEAKMCNLLTLNGSSTSSVGRERTITNSIRPAVLLEKSLLRSSGEPYCVAG